MEFKNLKNKYLNNIISMIVISFAICSCNPSKTLTKEQFLLNNNRVITKIKSLDRDEINAIIKQKPNKKLFGFFRFYLLAYNYSKSGKDNRIKRWIANTVAEEPVVLDTFLTKKTTTQLQLFLEKKGYFNALVKDSIIYKNRKANIIYTLIGNVPYRFNLITYKVNDSEILDIINTHKNQSLIQSGNLFDQNKIEEERIRLANIIRSNGYFNFNKEYIKFIGDSALKNNTVKTQIVIRNPTELVDTNHYKYFIGKVIIYPDFQLTKRDELFTDSLEFASGFKFVFNNQLKFKKDVLIKPVFFEPTKLFSQQDVEDTYKRFQNLKVFSNVNLDFKENSDSTGKKVDAYVRLSSLKKQSYSLEAEGTNSSGYFGIRGNLVYQNKNIFKGAEIFQIRTGLELKQLPDIVSSENQNTGEKIKNATFNTVEVGPEFSLTIPRFAFPFIKPYFSKKAYPKTVIAIAFNYQSNDNYTRSISNSSLAYNWREGKYKQHTVTPIDFNYIGIIQSDAFEKILIVRNNPLLTQSYRNLLITALKYSFLFNNQEDFKKFHTTYLRLNVETAGNLPQLINTLRGAEKDESNNYTIFRGIPKFSALEQPYAQYAKIEIDLRNYFNFTDSRTFVSRLDFGIAKAYGNSQSIPFVKSFIGGGTNDIRAWRARTLGPGNYNNTSATVIEKIGDIKLVGNFEYRYKVFKKLNAATFIDIGNIWLINTDDLTGKKLAHFNTQNFINGLAIGGGFGLRYDFSFFIFRLDLAAKFRDPSRKEGERWIGINSGLLNISNFNFLNIGIGYPF